MLHPAIRTALVAVLLAVFAPALAAQTVRGRLTEGEGGPSLGGTLVLLLDASGKTVARTLTDASGGYAFQAPGPGRYRLRVSRVGFTETTSPEFAVAAGQTVDRTLVFAAVSAGLEAIDVRAGASRRCTPRPREQGVAAVWGEARKALEASVVGEEEHGYAYAFTQYRRELDRRGTVTADERRESQARGRHPFASVPIETLVSDGFVQAKPDGLYYYAPDARVLLSEPFLEGHCFHLQASGDTLIGLAFEPVRGRTKSDVEGTLWLEPKSAALRRVEYRYVNLPVRVEETDGVGGRVDYERLPTGAFLVRRWWVRMPALRREEETGLSNAGHVAERRTRDVLMGLREEGGEVVRVTGRDGRDVLGVRHMAVRGTVYDSVAAAPLAGARVFLSGTTYAAESDSAGRYEITGVPEGAYTVSFNHAALRRVVRRRPAERRLQLRRPARRVRPRGPGRLPLGGRARRH
ncbi:MAG TPA: carboxypeptidase regulatory-like domain-containing protein, partial [Longimicrobium sp.]|nr:carboxypeptidase regulatory-like domain-containing protein [Longimicrobium sp.]